MRHQADSWSCAPTPRSSNCMLQAHMQVRVRIYCMIARLPACTCGALVRVGFSILCSPQAQRQLQSDVYYAAGSERATEQDGQQVLHLDLRQHAQAGGSVVLRLLALRPKGQLQLQSCTWTPASPENAVSDAPSTGEVLPSCSTISLQHPTVDIDQVMARRTPQHSRQQQHQQHQRCHRQLQRRAQHRGCPSKSSSVAC
jgi:hypothetical protein